MSPIPALDALDHILAAALAAVDPYMAVSNALQIADNDLHCAGNAYHLPDFERVLVIGFGKASAPMAEAVFDLLGNRITTGLVIVKYGHTLDQDTDLGPIELAEAGHPVPDEAGLAHTKRLTDLLATTTKRDLVITLVSGGGSALLTQPVAEISLANLQQLNESLLAAGADITEINTIRKHLSQVKGGHLAALVQPATMLNLILSDVIDDRLDMIASGPTSADTTTFADSLSIINRYALGETLPAAITTYLQAGAAGTMPETIKADDERLTAVTNHIVGSNDVALNAAMSAAAETGYPTHRHPGFLSGEAQLAAQTVAAATQQLLDDHAAPFALFFGGETTVTMDPASAGLGGRNQELALALAQLIDGKPRICVACFATDGNDGPTDAAGAIIAGDTIRRAVMQNLNAADFLAGHNSYHFFAQLNDLIITGPTNTNVNDLTVVLCW